VTHNRQQSSINFVILEYPNRASLGSSDETCSNNRDFSVDRWSYSYDNRRTTTPIYCDCVRLRYQSVPTTWQASAVLHFCLQTPWRFSNSSMVPFLVLHAIHAICYRQTIRLKTRHYRSRLLAYYRRKITHINYVYQWVPTRKGLYKLPQQEKPFHRCEAFFFFYKNTH